MSGLRYPFTICHWWTSAVWSCPKSTWYLTPSEESIIALMVAATILPACMLTLIFRRLWVVFQTCAGILLHSPAGPAPTSAIMTLGRSHPAADATREVVERWLLDGLDVNVGHRRCSRSG